MAKTRRKVMRPSLKDYLRTGIVQVVNIYESFDEDNPDEVNALDAGASAVAVVEPEPAPAPKPEPEAEREVPKVAKKRRDRKVKVKAKVESVEPVPATEEPKAESTKSVEPVSATEESKATESTAEPVEPAVEKCEAGVGDDDHSHANDTNVDELRAATPDEVQAFLEMLAPDDRQMWEMMIAAATEVTRERLSLESVRGEFESADRDRFTYYLLAERARKLVPVQRAEQITEPACCVLRWDENGAVRFSV